MTGKRRFIPRNPIIKAFVVVLVAIMAAVMYNKGIACVYMSLFEVPCPGCGITRATVALLAGRVDEAIEYYPAYGVLPILFLYFLYDGELFSKKWLNRTVFIICAVTVAVCYISRLINTL